MNPRPTLFLIGIAVALSPAAGSAAQITPVVVEGDPVPGVGAVEGIDGVAVNDFGQWLVTAFTDHPDFDADEVVLRDGVLILREGQPLADPPGATFDGFGGLGGPSLNNNGDSGWRFRLGGAVEPGNDSGIYFNTALVIREGDASIAPEFTPNRPYIVFYDVKIRPNDSSGLMVIAQVDDPATSWPAEPARTGRPSRRRDVIVRIQHDGSGNLVSESVLRKEGTIPPGQTKRVEGFGTRPHESAINDAGQILHFVDLEGDFSTDDCFYLDDTLLAQEGNPSPIPGRNYIRLADRSCDLSNSGAYVFGAVLDGGQTTGEVIIRNGAVFREEGDTLPDIAPFQLTSIETGSGPVEVDDGGNVLWYGDWDDPDITQDTGLFWNDELIVQEGVTRINGQVVDFIWSGLHAFQLSNNGLYAIFRARLEGGTEGAFLIELQGPVAITLSQLAAVPAQRDVVVSWVTSVEYQHDGFHVYRADSRDGEYSRLDGALVRGGPEYRFVDDNVRGNRTYWYRIGAVDLTGHEDLYGPVSARTPARVRVTGLAPVAPNPFVASTEISFELARDAEVALRIHDVAGRLVRDFSGTYPAGRHALAWDGRDGEGRPVPAGVYFAKFVGPDRSVTRKIVRAGLR